MASGNRDETLPAPGADDSLRLHEPTASESVDTTASDSLLIQRVQEFVSVLARRADHVALRRARHVVGGLSRPVLTTDHAVSLGCILLYNLSDDDVKVLLSPLDGELSFTFLRSMARRMRRASEAGRPSLTPSTSIDGTLCPSPLRAASHDFEVERKGIATDMAPPTLRAAASVLLRTPLSIPEPPPLHHHSTPSSAVASCHAPSCRTDR